MLRGKTNLNENSIHLKCLSECEANTQTDKKQVEKKSISDYERDEEEEAGNMMK